jgi:ABC-2 type transport system permease protein
VNFINFASSFKLKNMFSILRKEISSFLNSMIAYVVIVLFLVTMGLLMWVFPDTSVLEYGFADMETLFSMAPFVFMFLIPSITMRTFAEEKKSGTLELLFTKPLTDWDIILGKYFSTVLLIVVALVPTVVYYFSVSALGSPEGNIDTAAVIGSYIGLLLLGAVFASVGIFTSSISENQIISFIIGVFLCFILHSGFAAIASINVWGSFSYLIDSMGISYHYSSMSKGLIDSRDLVYFGSVITIMLLFTNLVIGSRKW